MPPGAPSALDSPRLNRPRSRIPVSAVRGIPASDAVLSMMIVLTACPDLFQEVKLGSVSLNGVLTLLYGSVVVLLLLSRASVSRHLSSAVWAGVAFAAWTVVSIAWNQARSTETIQNVSVILMFIGSVILVSGISAGDGRRSTRVLELLPFGVYLSTAIFLATITHLYGIQARVYALYASVGLMWMASGWRFRERGARLATLLVLFCIGWSLSRTALVACVVLLPWIVSFRAKAISGWIRPVMTLAILGAITVGAIFTVPALNKRFLGAGDRALTVNGTTVSTEGRAQIWQEVFKDGLRSPVIGLGAGSATDLVIKDFGVGIAQPHNDYLRIFHDYGVVGLALWLLFAVSISLAMRKRYRVAQHYGDLALQRKIIAGQSGFVVLLSTMITDNPLVYPGPMLLAAVLIGSALGSHVQRPIRRTAR